MFINIQQCFYEVNIISHLYLFMKHLKSYSKKFKKVNKIKKISKFKLIKLFT